MKILKFGFYATMFAMVLFVTACGSGEATTNDEDRTEHHDDHGHNHDDHSTTSDSIDLSSKEHTSAYICPMKCKGSGSDKAGECPVCEMKYKANEAHTKDNHEH